MRKPEKASSVDHLLGLLWPNGRTYSEVIQLPSSSVFLKTKFVVNAVSSWCNSMGICWQLYFKMCFKIEVNNSWLLLTVCKGKLSSQFGSPWKLHDITFDFICKSSRIWWYMHSPHSRTLQCIDLEYLWPQQGHLSSCFNVVPGIFLATFFPGLRQMCSISCNVFAKN
jgi:hypothetical protein